MSAGGDGLPRLSHTGVSIYAFHFGVWLFYVPLAWLVWASRGEALTRREVAGCGVRAWRGGENKVVLRWCRCVVWGISLTSLQCPYHSAPIIVFPVKVPSNKVPVLVSVKCRYYSAPIQPHSPEVARGPTVSGGATWSLPGPYCSFVYWQHGSCGYMGALLLFNNDVFKYYLMFWDIHSSS